MEQAPGADYPHLSTGDVFSWLANTGFSHHAVPQSASANIPPRRTSERISPSVVNTFCAACGLDTMQHPAPNSWPTCPFSPMSRFPLLDVGPHASAPLQDHPNSPVHHLPAQKKAFRWTIREVLAAIDPALTLAVRGIIGPLNLSCFPPSHMTAISGDGPSSTAIPPTVHSCDNPRLDFISISGLEYTSLASSAVLGIAVREFVRHLLHPAVTAFTGDHASGKGRTVLAPVHVCRSAIGSLARDGVFNDLPPSPVVLTLSTLVQPRPRDLSPPCAAMETS
jgi:hypothetical protein